MAVTEDQIIKIGKALRKQMEAYAKKNPFVFDPNNLKCMCAVASFTYKKSINLLGGKADFIYGHFYGGHHCWVQINKTIYDLTLTQFDKSVRKLSVIKPGHRLYSHYIEYSKNTQAIRNVARWGDQSPGDHRLFIDSAIAKIAKKFTQK